MMNTASLAMVISEVVRTSCILYIHSCRTHLGVTHQHTPRTTEIGGISSEIAFWRFISMAVFEMSAYFELRLCVS